MMSKKTFKIWFTINLVVLIFSFVFIAYQGAFLEEDFIPRFWLQIAISITLVHVVLMHYNRHNLIKDQIKD